MKANAPERIWIAPATDLPKLSGHIDANSVEYIRKDAFIEKAEEYIYKQLNEGCIECGDIERFIEGMKNYMKGE